jgi:Protein of unknown function (DUF1364)
MNLRKLARGKPCQIRSAVCNYDPETTVLAHYRLIGISGAGLKSPDVMGAWACSQCHALVDGQGKSFHEGGLSKDARDLLLLEGVMRTQNELIKLGILKW